MKIFKRLIIASIFISSYFELTAQSLEEVEIRKMEQIQIQAILNLDSAAIDTIWDKDLAVNSPTNNIVDKAGGMFAFKNGFIHYSSLQNEIENIMFYGDIAIVMGQETVLPIGKSPNTGKTVKRRYTNIWRKKGTTWTLFARQATNISIE